MTNIESHLIATNNPKLPLLIYRGVFSGKNSKEIGEIFVQNGWTRFWINGIYDFDHFHSNTHEALGISKGRCKVQIGKEKVFEVNQGDLLILPVGTFHKNVGSSPDFECVGSYPEDINYDMHYEKEDPLKMSLDKVPIPKSDPAFGKNGPLTEYWK